MINLLYETAALFNQNDINIPRTGADSSQISSILQIVFGFAGAIAVLVITIAGFQYVISQGDAQKIAKAKNTIIFALVGLVLTFSAFAIVRWVMARTV